MTLFLSLSPLMLLDLTSAQSQLKHYDTLLKLTQGFIPIPIRHIPAMESTWSPRWSSTCIILIRHNFLETTSTIPMLPTTCASLSHPYWQPANHRASMIYYNTNPLILTQQTLDPFHPTQMTHPLSNSQARTPTPTLRITTQCTIHNNTPNQRSPNLLHKTSTSKQLTIVP